VSINGVPNPSRRGEVDEPGPNGCPLDADTRLLTQLLATQTEMLATLKAIEAKMPTSTW
jgi:hypothetical protein